MIVLITIIFVLVLGYVYWKAAVYAAPFAMAFVFGSLASKLGGHWITVAIAALFGVFVTYLILGLLREMGKQWPLALWTQRLLVFAPSFYFAFQVMNYLMRNEWGRGAFESTLVSTVVGLILGIVAHTKFELQDVAQGDRS